MLESYKFYTLDSIEKSSVITNILKADVLNNPENVLIVSLDVKNLKSIIEQLNKFSFEKNNIHLICPGILEDETQMFALLNEILNVSKCKLFILQNKFSELKYFFEAADIANFHLNVHILHNSLQMVKNQLDDLNPKVFRSISNLSVSGFQQHLSEQISIEQNHFDHYRLGNIISQIEVLNKPIQFADALIADINVLKQSDVPSRSSIGSSGLTSEMFNQIARTTGLSKSTRVTILSGLDELREDDPTSFDTIAQFIYYYISGAIRSSQMNHADKFTNYFIEECLPYGSVTFLKNEYNMEWFAKYPDNLPDHYSKYQIIPCTYNDYQYSGQGELSPRLAEIFKWLDDLSK